MKDPTIRLKCNTREDHLANAMSYDPHTLEFFLIEEDLVDLKILRSKIERVLSNGTKLYLHEPMRIKGERPSISTSNEDILESTLINISTLIGLCKEYDIRSVVHLGYKGFDPNLTPETEFQNLYINIQKMESLGRGYIHWENGVAGVNTLSFKPLYQLVSEIDLSLCLDTSHVIISEKGNANRAISLIRKFGQYVDYYHLSDATLEDTEGSVIGTKSIDWKSVAEVVGNTDYITEINRNDLLDMNPLIESGKYFESIKQLVKK